jgi:hypothetical protein
MVTYEKLLKKPQVANSLIGMLLSEFDELYAEFESAYTERQTTSQHTPSQDQTPTRCGCWTKVQV